MNLAGIFAAECMVRKTFGPYSALFKDYVRKVEGFSLAEGSLSFLSAYLIRDSLEIRYLSFDYQVHVLFTFLIWEFLQHPK